MKYVVYGRTIPSLDRPASDPLIHMCSPDLERTWVVQSTGYYSRLQRRQPRTR